jgi:hypothetical protein
MLNRLEKSKSSRLYEVIEKYEDKCSDHPRELLDIICVADTATLSLGKHILIGNNLNKNEIEELKSLNAKGAVAAMYVIQDEDKQFTDLDFSGAILAGLIHELTYRIAFEDAAIRPWADHLSHLGFYGGIGRPFYCSENVLSEAVRQQLQTNEDEEDRWSKWSRNLP